MLFHPGTAGKTEKGRGGTSRVFGIPWFCLPKRGRFDENGENDEFAFYALKTRVLLLRPPKTTNMTKMAGVTQAKARFSVRAKVITRAFQLFWNIISRKLHLHLHSAFVSKLICGV